MFSSGKTLFIELDQELYEPEQTITGSVILNLASSTKIDFVALELCRCHKTKFELPEVSRWNLMKGSAPTANHKDKKSVRSKLYVGNGATLSQGVHRFPFRTELTKGDDSSYSYRGFVGRLTFILKRSYRLRAVVHVPSVYTPAVEEVREIQVEKTVLLKREFTKTERLFICGLFPRGTVAVRCEYEKDAFYAGENVVADVEIQHGTGGLHVLRVTASLVQGLGMKIESDELNRTVCVSKGAVLKTKNREGHYRLELETYSALPPSFSTQTASCKYVVNICVELICEAPVVLNGEVTIKKRPVSVTTPPVISSWKPIVYEECELN